MMPSAFHHFDFSHHAAQDRTMKKSEQPKADKLVGAALLVRELKKGLSSGDSKRSPAQIQADFRKASEAALTQRRR